MRTLIRLGLVAGVLVATTAVRAYPNFNATQGILAVPTAEIAPMGTLGGAADVLFQDDTTLNARVVLGLTPTVEAGAGLIIGEDTAFGLTGKLVLPITPGGFTWGLGASLIAADNDDGFQLFFTGTRPFGSVGIAGAQLLGTLGVSFTDIEDVSAIRPFLGAQLRLGAGTELASEFIFEAGDFDESIFSILLRQRFSERVSGQLGLTNALGFTGREDSDFFLGLGYAFGG
jgi:hypothetical protein